MSTKQNKFLTSISRKVWISLSIMIIGYLASMILGFILGIHTESRLQHVSESVFPAAMLSKAALTEFNEQIKLYKEAVVFGEAGILVNAEFRAKQTQDILKRLAQLLAEDRNHKEFIQVLITDHADFSTKAQALYSKMINDIDFIDNSKTAQEMTARNSRLQTKITTLTTQFSNHLKRDLVDIADTTRGQRYWNMVIFFIVVSISLILVTVIIIRSITRPLQKAVALAGAMANGDLSQKLDIQQQDEIGELARAMNTMAEKIEASQNLLESKVANRTATLEKTNQQLKEEITERKRTESELKKTQEQLLQAVRTAEQANKSKSEFLANMSHEIRTPLTGVIGMTEILMNSPLIPEQQDYVETIKVSGETLLSIINDILDIAKIEAGEFSLNPAPFDLKKSMTGIARIFLPLSQKKGLDFEILFLSNDSYIVQGDEIRFRQIIFNLVGNALKFTPQGKIEIRVKSSPQEKNTTRFDIEIEDTGIGIEPHFLENIFEKFTQADASDTRKHSGTGLGLYITRHLAELMGGTIQVQSTPGKGSIFHLALPFELAQTSDITFPIIQVTGGREKNTDTSRNIPLNILLAEDNRINQKLISTIIKQAGHKLDIAENGQQAVAMVKNGTYDLILMDIQMPEMSGIDATKAIRAAGITNLPIIAMTASAFEKDRRLCLDAGMNDFISKPLVQAELFAMISRYE